MEEDVTVDLKILPIIRMMKLRNKTALPEKKSCNLHRDSKLALNGTSHGHYRYIIHLTPVLQKKVVFIPIPCARMSEVLAGTDIFLTNRSNRQKFYNNLLSYRIAITITM